LGGRPSNRHQCFKERILENERRIGKHPEKKNRWVGVTNAGLAKKRSGSEGREKKRGSRRRPRRLKKMGGRENGAEKDYLLNQTSPGGEVFGRGLDTERSRVWGAEEQQKKSRPGSKEVRVTVVIR